ncbi:MAG: hypothetical protein E5V71_07955 [Mesorhizobium sp.]|nr:MAG: hypothetical protein E5V71_07955 [Mesorhizobium sp.]
MPVVKLFAPDGAVHLRTIILELDKAQELMAGNIDAELPEGMIESRHRSLVRRQAEPLELLP